MANSEWKIPFVDSLRVVPTHRRRSQRPRQVALAWLLQRSHNILIIAGTSSVDHLHENLKAADLKLPANIAAALDEIGATTPEKHCGRRH